MGGGVIQFPPLPAVPSAPELGPDPRQSRAARIRRAFDSMVGHDGEHLGVNLSTGFHAASVDVARLKGVIEDGLRHFTAAQLAERWDVDVQPWVLQVLRAWVQRVRVRTLTLEGNALQVRIETEDDAGHYAYEFDVFSGR